MADVVSEPEARPSRQRPAEPPKNAAESTIAGQWDRQPIGSNRLAFGVIALFWTAQFVYFTIDRLDDTQSNPGFLAVRAAVSVLGALLSFGILKLLQRTAGESFLKRAIVALALAFAGAGIHSLINWALFNATLGPSEGAEPWVFDSSFPILVYLFSWVYLAITVLLLSLTYGEELVQRERRIAELTSAADQAQLTALRYQLNPHFLFNSLNSAASLVAAERNAEAEAMLENLADFLRATLKLDPGKEITLRDELGLQWLYLEVEQARFPHRLRIEKDVPAELLDVLVPNLITQPLIENSIKHGVAQSTRPVCVTVAAREEGGQMVLSVRDSGGNAASARPGLGVGLENVARRLRLHFGPDAEFKAGASADGGFEAVLRTPIRRKS